MWWEYFEFAPRLYLAGPAGHLTKKVERELIRFVEQVHKFNFFFLFFKRTIEQLFQLNLNKNCNFINDPTVKFMNTFKITNNVGLMNRFPTFVL